MAPSDQFGVGELFQELFGRGVDHKHCAVADCHHHLEWVFDTKKRARKGTPNSSSSSLNLNQ